MTTAIILAGGLGTRLRSVVHQVPKPMADIQGNPFLHYQLEYWRCQGVNRFVLAVGYLHECILDYFGDDYQGVPIHYSIEPSAMGTGGALLLAMQCLQDEAPFLLLNGDTFFEVSLPALLAFHREQRADWSFALFKAQEPARYMGMAVETDGQIRDLKAGAAAIGDLACGGVYVVEPRSIDTLGFSEAVVTPEAKLSLEDTLLPSALSAGQRLAGTVFDGAFIDIGIPRDYERAYSIISPHVRLSSVRSPIQAVDTSTEVAW